MLKIGFQTRFVKAVEKKSILTACLSCPRGQGKSFLAGHIIARALTPSDSLFVEGSECALVAASIEQARIVFRFARKILGEKDYRYTDSATRVAILHKKTHTRLRVIGSNGRTAMGLVNCPYLIADEPGSWEVRGGQLLHDAITTAQGKFNSPLTAIYIGTIAPSKTGWWHDLVKGGSRGSTHVQLLQADIEKWDHWNEIMRVNPLARVSPELRAKLLEERDEARRDGRLKARFLSYRLNLPTADESEVLLSVPDWERTLARDIPERVGRPIVGIDLGAGRAWSAAVAIWENGRVEALAIAPGVPNICEQEKRDQIASGQYQKLIETGALRLAENLRVPPTAMLIFAIRSGWGTPARLVCDRFREAELKDAVAGICPIETRVTRWSAASEDIRALRKIALDGPLNIDEKSRPLLTASLAVTQVKNDDQGSVRLIKQCSKNTARDDVSSALVLAAGAYVRANRHTRTRYRSAIVG